jgi:hypothetical protein
MEPPDGYARSGRNSPSAYRTTHWSCGQSLYFLLLLTVYRGTEIMSSTPRDEGTYDPQVYPLSAPWNGVGGGHYLNLFRPQFMNGLSGATDAEGWSLYEHAVGTDMGGNAPNAPSYGGEQWIRARDAYRARSSQLNGVRSTGTATVLSSGWRSERLWPHCPLLKQPGKQPALTM